MTIRPKRYATMHHPTIQAVVHELYRFATVQDAIRQLDTLKQHFIVAKKQIENTAHPSLILWIKGYGLSDADLEAGMLGHYAVISFKPVEYAFTLFAAKMDVSLQGHPQRALVKRDNPNWGHPVLRAIRKGKIYPTPEAAQAELALLHAQYPSVSIPTPGKLYIMIYCSQRPPKQRMVKHTLEIAYDEGRAGYRITCKENTAKPKPPALSAVPPALPQGAFTAKVALSRQRKKKPKPSENG